MILRRGKHNVRIIKLVDDDKYDGRYPGQLRGGRVRGLLYKLQQLLQMSDAELRIYMRTRADQALSKGSNDSRRETLMFPEFAADGKYLPHLENQVKDLIEKVMKVREKDPSYQTKHDKFQSVIDFAETQMPSRRPTSGSSDVTGAIQGGGFTFSDDEDELEGVLGEGKEQPVERAPRGGPPGKKKW